jgi:hypothetical protein
MYGNELLVGHVKADKALRSSSRQTTSVATGEGFGRRVSDFFYRGQLGPTRTSDWRTFTPGR